jgi:hypothetical protein
MSFDDITVIRQLVRSHLRRLQHLELAPDDISTAEKVCRDLLYADMLSDFGPIDHLVIFVGDQQDQLFGVVRYLSTMCGPNPSIGIKTCGDVKDTWTGDVSKRFLRDLRRWAFPSYLDVLRDWC